MVPLHLGQGPLVRGLLEQVMGWSVPPLNPRGSPPATSPHPPCLLPRRRHPQTPGRDLRPHHWLQNQGRGFVGPVLMRYDERVLYVPGFQVVQWCIPGRHLLVPLRSYEGLGSNDPGSYSCPSPHGPGGTPATLP